MCFPSPRPEAAPAAWAQRTRGDGWGAHLSWLEGELVLVIRSSGSDEDHVEDGRPRVCGATRAP